MAHVLPYEYLLEMAGAVGILLIESEGEGNLYVMVDEDGNDLYVGKAEDLCRHTNEDTWVKTAEYKRKVYSGFIPLCRENNAVRKKLVYSPQNIDAAKAKDWIEKEGWEGPGVERVLYRIEKGQVPTLREVEQILVRIHIHSGRLIGNSQFASQWERSLGSYTDTMAALAVDYGRMSGLI